jgi:tetratricopeptide (TPR) repeat protein
MKHSFLFVVFFTIFSLVGQNGTQYGNMSDASRLCQIFVEDNGIVSSNPDAEKALDKIVAVTGISRRFALYECNGIENCQAITFRGIRYIFYDSDFMKSISQNTGSSWTNISILAHEVGHHVNGHSLDWLSIATGDIEPLTLAQKRQQELEADEFSGFVLFKLGASLIQAQLAVSQVSSNSDDTYSTHPERTKRLKAIEKGFNEAKRQSTNYEVKTLTASDYFYKAYNAPKDDHKYKIENYSRAIELDPYLKDAYLNRGNEFYNLKMHDEAINDFTKAIEIDVNYAFGYYNRGYIYSKLSKYREAINDYNKAIKYDPGHRKAYNNRGLAYFNLYKYQEAINDYNKAIEIDPNDAISFNNRGIALSKTGKRQEALLDYNRAIELNPNYKEAYNNRGLIYNDQGRNQEAIIDFSKALELDSFFADAYCNRGGAFIDINKYEEALKDFNKAIELEPIDVINYYNRGNAYYYLLNYKQAIADYSKAIEIDPNYTNAYYNRAMAKKQLEIEYCNDIKKSCELGYSEACELYQAESCN